MYSSQSTADDFAQKEKANFQVTSEEIPNNKRKEASVYLPDLFITFCSEAHKINPY